MKILITGAGGFIASWLIQRLHRRGIEVRAMDLNASGRLLEEIAPEAAPSVAWVTGDVADIAAIRTAAQGCDLIVHLAAILTPACQADPLLGARINLIGTLNVFEVAKELGHDKVLYMSSAGVFGPADGATPWPTTHYGAFKLASEGSARAYYEDHGLTSLGIRPLVVYGPGREVGLTAGPTLACRAAVNGETYDIPFAGESGFIYVDDVAAVFDAAVDTSLDGAEVYNMGGEVAALSAIANSICQLVPGAKIGVSGPPIPIIANIEDNGVRERFPDVANTSVNAGLAATIRHYQMLRQAT